MAGSNALVSSSHKMPAFVIKPKIASVRSMAAQLPLQKSLCLPLNGKWAYDLGLYNRPFFKLGFGPQNTLIVPNSRNNIKADIKSMFINGYFKYNFKYILFFLR